jgi:hypothetical protein
MHQMRAVALRKSRRFRIQRGRNHSQPVIRTQRPRALLPTFLSRSRISRCLRGSRCRANPRTSGRPRIPIVLNRPRPLLRPRDTKRQPAQPNHQRAFSPIPHRPIVMPIPSSVMVTIVQGSCRSDVVRVGPVLVGRTLLPGAPATSPPAVPRNSLSRKRSPSPSRVDSTIP